MPASSYTVAEGQAQDSCEHIAQVATVEPSTPGQCEDCIREGSRWVHLRLCLSCGHMGCCDNSPRRHATAHWHASRHPVIRSAEPGEEWAWCYPDELMLVPIEV
ncbi:MAG: UBP-type zinc finger domain-containing protein [Acidimicrobiales bacterium]|nr:UBP-type zinc finger domain-containing protein [Acidimicrobiales bacterium]